jgi:hypothetical protein
LEINMKSLVRVIVAGLLLSSTVYAAEGSGPGQKGKKQAKSQPMVEDNRGSGVAVHVVFLPREVSVIREYYAPRYRNLPPGLQKKLARTGQLPPGWRKKMEPFPVAVERQLAVLPDGYRRGVFDGHAVIYNPRTQVIVDLAVLF